MANEITSGPGDGKGNYPLLFIYPILTPKVWNGSAVQVVPTPAAGLPDWAQTIVTADEKADLDAGDALFYVYSSFRPTGLTAGQMIAQARLIYAQFKIRLAAWYLDVYKYPGNRINEA
jgi:hypothetical protein